MLQSGINFILPRLQSEKKLHPIFFAFRKQLHHIYVAIRKQLNPMYVAIRK